MPPVITGCPFRVAGMADMGTSEGLASWVEPTAEDNSGELVQVDRTHTPSTLFPVGSTTVTYYFTDPSGNEAVCSFMVTIEKGTLC